VSSLDGFFEGVWLGRAGQGAGLASYILAEAAMLEGKKAFAMPEFGAERRGAPVKAYNRILLQAEEFDVVPRSPVVEADFLVVMEPHFVARTELFPLLKRGGVVVANSKKEPSELRAKLREALGEGVAVCTVDATRISLEELGRDIVNTTLLGSLVRAAPVVSLDSLKLALSRRLPQRLAAANLRALERGYKEVRVE